MGRDGRPAGRTKGEDTMIPLARPRIIMTCLERMKLEAHFVRVHPIPIVVHVG